MTRADSSEIWAVSFSSGGLSPDSAGLPGTDPPPRPGDGPAASGDLDQSASTAARVGLCSKPVRLVGSSVTVHRTTGEVVRTYASTDEPPASRS